MEAKIEQLSAALTALGGSQGENSRVSASASPGLSHLPLQDAATNGAPDTLGYLEAGRWGAGERAIRLDSTREANLSLSAGQSLYLRASRHLNIKAPVLHVETSKMDVDGELAARPAYTGVFSWRSGQPPVRMVHHSLGLPVLTRLEENGKNTQLRVRMYIDETDGYWYLCGQAEKGAKVVAEAICFGRV